MPADAVAAQDAVQDSPCLSAHPTILVPLDGTALAERALPYAVSLARRHGSTLLLIEVADQQRPAAAAHVYLRRWADRLAVGCGVTVSSEVAGGSAGRAIVEEAAERAVDLIVMATHARTGVERMVMGSVADYVLHHAHAPVMLVPAACDRTWDGTAAGETA